MTLKISLVDNDYVIRAKTDLPVAGKDNGLVKFLTEIDEELITGKSAYLEVEGTEKGTVTYEISKLE